MKFGSLLVLSTLLGIVMAVLTGMLITNILSSCSISVDPPIDVNVQVKCITVELPNGTITTMCTDGGPG